MGVRENKVEKYLRERFERVGGATRKWVSPGRDGVPDQICFLGRVYLVEVKTTDGGLSDCQIREHKRLRKASATVTTVWGNTGVDKLMSDIFNGEPVKREYR